MNKSVLLMLLLAVSACACPCAWAEDSYDIDAADIQKTDRYLKVEESVEKMIPDGGVSVMTTGAEDTIQIVFEMMDEDFSRDVFSGAKIEAVDRNLVQALVPKGMITGIAANPEVLYARLPNRPHPTSISEGVDVMDADILHSIQVTGEGVKVGVIDLGFYGYEDLENVVKAWSFDGDMGNEVHGAACAEVVSEVAPGAAIYLYKMDTEVTFSDAVDEAIADGVDVITCSVGWVNAGPYDGTGTVCEIAERAADAGIKYVNSAGNQAQRHYEGYFSDEYDGDNKHEFSYGTEVLYLGEIAEDDMISLYLSWDDWVDVDQDYDLYLLEKTGTSWVIAARSANMQNGVPGQRPTEKIGYLSEGGEYGVGIMSINSREDAHFELYSFHNYFLTHNVSSSSLLIPADARGVITAGATWYYDDSLERFSSQGPTNDGRMKPDVTGPDGVSNDVYGRFYGTSAAAPHTAGAIALLMSADPSVSDPEEYIYSTAVDLLDTGADYMTGYGRVDVWSAYEALPDSAEVSGLKLSAGESGEAELSVMPYGVHGYVVAYHDEGLEFDYAGETDAHGMDEITVSISDSASAGTYRYMVIVDGEHEAWGEAVVPDLPGVPEFPTLIVPLMMTMLVIGSRMRY